MDLLLLFSIGLFSSFFGNFASGTTSALSLSGLLAFGLPSYTALATHRLGLFGFDLGGIKEYVKHNKVDWNLIPTLSLIGIVAAIIGSNIILSVDQELLSKLIGIVILFFIPIMFIKPQLGIVKTKVTQTKQKIGFFSTFLLLSGAVVLILELVFFLSTPIYTTLVKQF